MSCVIIKNDGIGDLILASGIISSIAILLNEQVDLVTCVNNKEVAENIHGVRNIYYVSRDDLRYNRLASRVGLSLLPKVTIEDAKVLREIGRQKYDRAICLRRFIRASSLFIMRAVCARDKLCMWQFPTNVSAKIAQRLSEGWDLQIGDQEIRHEVEYYQTVLEKVFGSPIDTYPYLGFLEGYTHCAEVGRVGIAIGGPGGNWPIYYWVELVRMLEQDGWRIFLFGGKDAVRNAALIEKSCKRVSNNVGKMTLLESITLLKSLSGFIGNETGFTHFASLFVPKVLIVYGGRTFKRFFPWPGSFNQYVIFHGLECFDCNNNCQFLFHKYRCLLCVKPNDVLTYFFEIVEGEAPRFRNLNSQNVHYFSIQRETTFIIDGEGTGT